MALTTTPISTTPARWSANRPKLACLKRRTMPGSCQRIARATAAGCGTAVRCGAPMHDTLHRPDAGRETLVAYVRARRKRSCPCVTASTVPRFAAADHNALLAIAGHMAADGLRVWRLRAVASRRRHPIESGTVRGRIGFSGLAGLLDPHALRRPPAIADCKSAGIVPVDDHRRSPGNGARHRPASRSARMHTAKCWLRELAKMPDAEFARHVRTVRVYARAARNTRSASCRHFRHRVSSLP